MNLRIIFLFTLMAILVGSGCKKKDSGSNQDNQQDEEKSLFEAFNLLNNTYDMFNEKAALSTNSPKNAMMMTDEWLNTQGIVSHTEVYDSSYIEVTTKAGMKTTFILSLINPDSTPIYRGGTSSSGGRFKSLVNNSGPCSNVIQNKKVLIYAAEFVPGQKILDYFDNSDVGFEVTFKKKEECRPELIETFKDYGLVILDTHGETDAFMSGLKFEFKKDSSNFQEFKNAIVQQVGEDNYNRFLKGYLIFGSRRKVVLLDPNWWKEPLNLNIKDDIWVTTKYIAASPQLTNTIIFGNMCYSGFQSYTDPISNPPEYYMVPAWQKLHPRSYYGYAYNDGFSTYVDDEFARSMEDSLVRSLVIDKDSTGNAYLKSDNSEFFDPDSYWDKHGNFFFKHFESPSWCYGGCEDNFTDPRDGQQYKTVCIGKQRWMAENLNYNSGGVCYDDNGANCDIYGRLYTIDEATGRDTSSANPSGVRGICPEGWHIPSQAEWEQLFNYCGGADEAAYKLRTTTGWPEPNQNTDEFGFGMQAGGLFAADALNSIFENLGKGGYFWTSNENYLGNFIAVHGYYPGLDFGDYSPPPDLIWKFSVRCVKD